MDDLNGFMDTHLFKRLIDEIEPHPDTILVLHRRGESLLHRDFIEMLGYIEGKFSTVQMATNATVLDEKRAAAIIKSCTFLSFSIDAPHLYEKTRPPGKYKSVEANILRFLEMNRAAGNPVSTQVSMVKTDDVTEEDAQVFEGVWKERVSRIRVYEEHSKDGSFGSLKRDRGERKPCSMPFYEMLIYCDGKVGRCNHDWDGEPIGDVTGSSISQVWKGEACADLRRQHTTLKITDKVCASCDSWYPEEGNQGTGKVVEND